MAESDAGSAARAAAARAVSAVIHKSRSLDSAQALFEALEPADRGLARMLAYGTLRDLRLLESRLAPRLSRRPQPLLHALLLVGLHQLSATRVPDHAAVHATVAACAALGVARARGMVNAVLRAQLREADTPAGEVVMPAAERYSYPGWLARAIGTDWGDAAEQIMAAGNIQAPMHLRINRRRTRRDEIQAKLAAAGIDCMAVSLPDASGQGRLADLLTLSQPLATQMLPGFAEGLLSVQDGAAQIAVELLTPADGQRVLDACAAPGNKSAHMLEHADIDLLALDIDDRRLTTLDANLARLGLRARVETGDAAAVEDWWDGRPFDRILLDAPCSGTGVIRRHPDIKWLRRESDIGVASARQRALLDALWPTLASGGRLVYATCSILRAEGRDVVGEFLAATGDAQALPIGAGWGERESVGFRIAPGEDGFDGFYYAVIEKRSAG